MAAELRHRPAAAVAAEPPVVDSEKPSAAATKLLKTPAVTGAEHPAGEKRYGRTRQILRQLSFGFYFVACVVAIATAQILGAPLYWLNRGMYYSYMSLTKTYFGLVITTMTKWWGPTTIRISGDASVAGQLRQTPDGRAEFAFPERLVLIANHQLYTDWLYLWWVAYANHPQTHGWIFIILKESLKYIPIIGTGMMFYGFIFMSRKMAVDRPRMAHRLQKLKVRTPDPSAGGALTLNPMWLLLFPEGTNASGNGRVKSAKWAEKSGIVDPRHMLLPRSTGMFFCLSELKGTVDYVYDCTVAYEGIPRGKFGEDYFTLSSTYFQGRPPKSVNFFWRRFRVADIPLETQEAFDGWLRDRWAEKDDLMEVYMSTGRFPSSHNTKKKTTNGNGNGNGNGASSHSSTNSTTPDYIETEVRNKWPGEVLKIFVIPFTFLLVCNLVLKAYAGLVSAFS